VLLLVLLLGGDVGVVEHTAGGLLVLLLVVGVWDVGRGTHGGGRLRDDSDGHTEQHGLGQSQRQLRAHKRSRGVHSYIFES